MNMPRNPELFDGYADKYEDALARGISVSGERHDYFARGRVEWLRRCLRGLGVSVRSVLDFGCGTGGSAPHFHSLLNVEQVVGVDVSWQSLQIARERYGSDRIRFAHVDDFPPAAAMDLVFCNGVFHHLLPSTHATTLEWVFNHLRPGGYFAFWENNPWNPGARLVMKRILFDRDAIMISAAKARHMVRSAGFGVTRTDFLFIFPRTLALLRGVEPYIASLPLGAQYQVLAKKPD